MGAQRLKEVLGRVRRRLAGSAGADGIDRDLLMRFVHQRDEAAFARLVERHAPLVLGVGRRVLRNEDEALDVFQATFFILARKAAGAAWEQSVAGWLYRVAYRLALRARSQVARRREIEHRAGIALAREGTASECPQFHAALDEELNALADHYRTPLVLCYLEGKTRDQGAR